MTPGDAAARTDRVWHRALGWRPASELPGDVAAHVALEFHGLVMNGGVLNAVEDREDAHLASVVAAYRWLRLAGVADLVDEVRRAVAEGRTEVPAQAEALEVDADRRHDEHLPDDSALEAALHRRVVNSPEAFS
ncbi:hypothetical protein FE634_08980 [Nocardioides dongxiaopingii]|uniref:hypothetical protein n=1 Tax=Nocardioides sp. S-1144 TaxID=2582905 RepID=UPI0011637A19|nr:hypothetical protein [Nocardioides sp. S-1144]QCW50514.2 hypothetical protein FE634_08980 [Nocardioides sp. S-1144]